MSPLFQKSKSISILVATAFFMENLDGTVIATALPQMGVSFHTNPVDLNIGMTAYLLMLAVFIPITSPRKFTKGPPLLPGLMAASVWMKS